MKYTLKNTNGMVNFLLRSGKDFVKSKMEVKYAMMLTEAGKIKKSDMKEYPVEVDGKWYFEGSVITPKKVEKEDAK